MLQKLLIAGVIVGCSASLPILLQSHPEAFEHVMRFALDKSKDMTAEAPMTIATAVSEPETSQPLGRKVLVAADNQGHFVTTFKVNGRPVDAMVDTGATVVALTASTARKVGISLSSGDYNHEVSTANGQVKVAVVTVDSIQLGKITLEDVQAVVIEDKALRTNLIGMSFLKRLDKYQVQDGALLLAQ